MSFSLFRASLTVGTPSSHSREFLILWEASHCWAASHCQELLTAGSFPLFGGVLLFGGVSLSGAIHDCRYFCHTSRQWQNCREPLIVVRSSLSGVSHCREVSLWPASCHCELLSLSGLRVSYCLGGVALLGGISLSGASHRREFLSLLGCLAVKRLLTAGSFSLSGGSHNSRYFCNTSRRWQNWREPLAVVRSSLPGVSHCREVSLLRASCHCELLSVSGLRVSHCLGGVALLGGISRSGASHCREFLDLLGRLVVGRLLTVGSLSWSGGSHNSRYFCHTSRRWQNWREPLAVVRSSLSGVSRCREVSLTAAFRFFCC